MAYKEPIAGAGFHFTIILNTVSYKNSQFWR